MAIRQELAFISIIIMAGSVAPLAAVPNVEETTAQQRIVDCAAKFGKSGKKLPALIADAVRSLPPYVTGEGERFYLTAAEVVFLPAIRPFAACLGGGDPETANVETLAAKRMFSLGIGEFPIFVNGELPDTRQAMAAYAIGMTYLHFTFARYLGHEMAHIVLRTSGEMLPLAYEEYLVRRFLKEGKLPPECRVELVAILRQENMLTAKTFASALHD